MVFRNELLRFVIVLPLLLAMTPDLNSKTILLDESDNNTRVVLYVGDSLAIKLKSNVTTGYSWDVANLPSSLQQLGSKTEPGKSGRVGEPGFQTFTFKSTMPGDYDLQLNYSRPFEKNSRPAKTYHLSLSIEPRSGSPPT
jgi:inhibitor of cysteine peptidase